MPLSTFRSLPPADQHAQRAWVEYGEGKCPGCGGQWHRTTDPEDDTRYVVEDVVCHRCEAVAAEKAHQANENQRSATAHFGRHMTVREVHDG